MKKLLVITGCGHSGTTLAYHMLDLHPDVCIPKPLVSPKGGEMKALRMFGYRMVHNTPILAKDYLFEEDKFVQLMTRYINHANELSGNHCILKLPFFPLIWAKPLHKFTHGNLVFLCTKRPVVKVVKSYVTRGEANYKVWSYSRKQANKNGREFLIKLGSPDKRKKLLNSNAEKLLAEYCLNCNRLREQWNPEYGKIVDLEYGKISSGYMRNILKRLGLPAYDTNKMVSIVEPGRL